MNNIPRYPIYVISKGRYDCCLTANFLVKDKVKFKLVVEPQEAHLYELRYGKDLLLITPENFSQKGKGSIPVRNFVWEHSKSQGFERHWILDDNIDGIYRRFRGKRFYCKSGPAFCAVEDFIDRYENVGIGGLNYGMFITGSMPPFYLNVHVYSCLLIKNDLKYRWRGRYNEDTDLCLQVLSGNWCTVLMNIFSILKKPTMTMKGGNMESLYKGDGRLRMARALERMWPKVVSVKRKFKRPQHHIKKNWQLFDTQLKLKQGVKLEDFKPNEYGLKLIQKDKIRSKNLQRLIKDKLELN